MPLFNDQLLVAAVEKESPWSSTGEKTPCREDTKEKEGEAHENKYQTEPRRAHA
jgi:hypothetical protein